MSQQCADWLIIGGTGIDEKILGQVATSIGVIERRTRKTPVYPRAVRVFGHVVKT